jgi:hypothetical protein
MESGVATFTALLDEIGVPAADAAATEQRRLLDRVLCGEAGAVRCASAGSALTNTGIRGHSVQDVLVSLPTHRVRPNSVASVRWLAEVVEQAIPGRGVTCDPGAVVVPFGPGEADRHRLIPASLIERSSNDDEIYVIPDGEAGWTPTCPSRHRRFLDRQDRRAESAARSLVRFTKAWKYRHRVPVSSFYLELAALSYVAQQSAVLYSQALADLFQGFLDDRLEPVSDPTCVSGTVRPVRNVFDHVLAMEAVEAAVGEIEKARAAMRANEPEQSLEFWRSLFIHNARN